MQYLALTCQIWKNCGIGLHVFAQIRRWAAPAAQNCKNKFESKFFALFLLFFAHCMVCDASFWLDSCHLSLMNFLSIKTNNVKFHCGWGQRLRTRLWTLWLWFSKVLKLGAIDLMIYDSFCLQNFNFYKFYRIKYSILLFFVLLCLLFCRGRREGAAILSDPTDRTERPMSHSKYWDEVETPLLLFSYVGEAKRYIVA